MPAALSATATNMGAVGAAHGASIAMPGLVIGGPLAPLAAMLTAGVLGGALLGGTAGSLISCREIGVQNETHFMMSEFRKIHHPEGFLVSTIVLFLFNF